MCFSAEADVVAGVLVTAVGIDALGQARRPADRALACLPVLLGAHLLVEAVVWWGLTGVVSPSTGRWATWMYLILAVGVLPVLVPLAVRGVEAGAGRRRAMAGLAAVGAGLAAVYLAALLQGSFDVRIEGRHLAYRLGIDHGGIAAGMYALVACGPPLLSSHRRVAWFGVANLAAAWFLTWLASSTLTSLWCAWAAVTSVAIAAHIRAHQERPDLVASAS